METAPEGIVPCRPTPTPGGPVRTADAYPMHTYRGFCHPSKRKRGPICGEAHRIHQQYACLAAQRLSRWTVPGSSPAKHTRAICDAQARVQGLEAEVQELRQQLQAMQLDRTNQQAQLDQLSRVALRTVAEPPPPPTEKKVRLRAGKRQHVSIITPSSHSAHGSVKSSKPKSIGSSVLRSLSMPEE